MINYFFFSPCLVQSYSSDDSAESLDSEMLPSLKRRYLDSISFTDSSLSKWRRLNDSQEINRLAALKIQQVYRGHLARNQLIERYIHKHFNVIISSTPTPLVSSKQVLYFGEDHLNDVHAFRIGRVITHLFKNGDRVLVEDQSKPEPWRCSAPEPRSQVRFVTKEIELWGWDEKLPELRISLNNIYALGECVDSAEIYFNSTSHEQEKKEAFDKILRLMGTLSFKDDLSLYLDDSVFIEKAIEKDSGAFLKTMIILAGLYSDEYHSKITEGTFSQRQKQLAKKVYEDRCQNKGPYRQLFLIAGQNHLLQGDEIEKDLLPTLSDHDYAILIPKEIPLSKEEKKMIERHKSQNSARARASSPMQEKRVFEFSKMHYEEALPFFYWAQQIKQLEGTHAGLRPDGAKFEGVFERGKLLKGKVIVPQEVGNMEMEGQFEGDMELRRGIIRYSDGMVMEGEFVDELILTTGRCMKPDDWTAEGVFNREGELIRGKLTYSDGNTEEGYFEERLLVKGMKTYPDGIIEKGVFVDEMLINGARRNLDGTAEMGVFFEEQLKEGVRIDRLGKKTIIKNFV